MATLDLHFEFASCAFSVGDVKNVAASNQKSLRVLSFAKLFKFSDENTVKLWGEHYRGVLKDPNGTSHGNLRAFIAGGLESVKFEKSLLEDVILSKSEGAEKQLLAIEQHDNNVEKASSLEEAEEHFFRNLINDRVGERLCVTLRADNDFYSQQTHLRAKGLAYTTESLKSLPSFQPCVNEQGETEVNKTGLGSSAAMVTSVISSLLAFLVGPAVDLSRRAHLDLVHGVAQLTHGVMQGKIGSGFDVCAAVYGSMQYVRYDPQGLSAAMAQATVSADCVVPPDGPTVVLDSLSSLNHQVDNFQLPPRLELMCGDVCGGSETPSMSSKILNWRKQADGKPDGQLWHDLLGANNAVADCFVELQRLSDSNFARYDAALDFVAAESWSALQGKQHDDPTIQQLLALREHFFTIRELFRKIGDLADVPVEPPCQTKLCDATMEQPGAVICGVPGAGGFDAVFAVVINSCRSNIERFWAEKTDAQVCALLLRESRAHPGILLSSE
jgi:phosphomevalonate kinase